MTQGQRIFRNAAALLVSQPLTWALTLVFTVIVPRNVGPSEWGEWVIAGSVTSVAAAVFDFGLNTVLFKEVARGPANASRLLGTVLTARLALLPLLAAGVLGFGHLAGYSGHTLVILSLITLSLLVSYVCRPAAFGLMAFEKMHVNALANVLTGLIQTVVAVLLVKFFALGIISISVVAFCANVLGLALQWAWLGRQVRLRPVFDPNLIRQLFTAGLPYWATQLFFTVYVWVDGIILSVAVSQAEVGWYGVGAQIISTLGFLPYVVTTVVFPELSRSFHQDQDRTAVLAGRSFRLLVTLGVPTAAGLALVAEPLVRAIYGDWFAPAGAPLTLLALTLLPVYAATLVNAFIIAADRQVQWTGVMGAMCVINPVINMVTIPYFHAHQGNGALGAAVALLVTDILTGVVALVLLPGALRHAVAASAPAVLRSLLATAVMAAAVWPLRWFFLPIPVLAGATTFGACALVLRVFPPDELRLMASFAGRPLTRLLRRGGRAQPTSGAEPAT